MVTKTAEKINYMIGYLLMNMMNKNKLKYISFGKIDRLDIIKLVLMIEPSSCLSTFLFLNTIILQCSYRYHSYRYLLLDV